MALAVLGTGFYDSFNFFSSASPAAITTRICEAAGFKAHPCPHVTGR